MTVMAVMVVMVVMALGVRLAGVLVRVLRFVVLLVLRFVLRSALLLFPPLLLLPLPLPLPLRPVLPVLAPSVLALFEGCIVWHVPNFEIHFHWGDNTVLHVDGFVCTSILQASRVLQPWWRRLVGIEKENRANYYCR